MTGRPINQHAIQALARQRRVLLKMCATTLRWIAEQSGNPDDRRAADEAEDLAEEDEVKELLCVSL